MRPKINSGLFVALSLMIFGMTARVCAQAPASSSAVELERSRANARNQFARNFRELQINGQKLLKDHKSRKLTPGDLARHARNINKNAKNVRSLLALGNLAEKVEIEKNIDTPDKFDESIQRLATLIWDFAHNPIHKNSKVFNTDLAAQAQTDLLAIIDMSKILESVARDYYHNGVGEK